MEIKNIKKLESLENKKKPEVLMILITLFIAIGGIVLNLLANIFHDFIKEINNPTIYYLYVLIISLLYLGFILTLWYWVNKFYMKPLEKFQKSIEDLKDK